MDALAGKLDVEKTIHPSQHVPTRRVEQIILIRHAGCSPSLDSFEPLFEPDAHHYCHRTLRFRRKPARKRSLGSSHGNKKTIIILLSLILVPTDILQNFM
jgi:hypothetical protein